MAIRRATLLLILLSLAALLRVQPAAAQAFINVNGRLDDRAPRQTYPFDGLRGDVISVRLTVTGGDLDAILTIVDSSGAILALRDDAPGGGQTLTLDSLRIPASSRYSVVVSRFGDRLGTTAGDFTLTVERIGVSSESGSALRYGDSVYNEIDDAHPLIYYSFRGRAGDVISVRMRRATGDLDPALQVLNSRAEILGEADDSPGSLDAAINGLILREEGVFVIVASRFGREAGRSRGAFVLTLDAASESGLGSRIDFPIPIEPNTPITGAITRDYTQRFFAFEGRRDQTVSVRMSRAGGSLDTLVALLSPDGRELVSDDDSGGGQNSLIAAYRLPADGVYLILATRYQRDAGESLGDFTLEITLTP